jgi:hypothetical protein
VSRGWFLTPNILGFTMVPEALNCFSILSPASHWDKRSDYQANPLNQYQLRNVPSIAELLEQSDPRADLTARATDSKGNQLHAALVYEANCQNLTDKFELIPIDRPTAKAVQNIAVGRNSEHAQMSSRLISAILSTTSRERFLGEGFSWEAIVETK